MLSRMTHPENRSRENWVRIVAQRRGYRLVTSRRRDPLAVDYGRYRVETMDGVEASGFESTMGWGLTLDEVVAKFKAQKPPAR